MSTVVDDIPSGKRPRVSSAAMRERILSAARGAFSRAGYDAVGVREIAGLAGTDPAIVIRLFGSKAALFTTLVEGVFAHEPVFDGPIGSLGERLAAFLLQPFPAAGDADAVEGDDLQLLLRSATSLTAAPILAAAMQDGLIEPLGRRIGGVEGAARAALVVAQVLGLATLRFGLGSRTIEGADRTTLARIYGAAIQQCVEAD